MAARYPYASHLLNDEVDYELMIRNYGEEITKELDVKQRLLRRLFCRDSKENKDYISPYSIDQEFDIIASRVNAISTALSKGSDPKLVSRLRHYLLRSARSAVADEDGQRMKDNLIKNIKELLGEHSAASALLADNVPDEIESSDRDGLATGTNPETPSRESNTSARQSRQTMGSGSLGAIKKKRTSSKDKPLEKNRDESPSKEFLKGKVRSLEVQLNNLTSRFDELWETSQANLANYERALSTQETGRHVASNSAREHQNLSRVRPRPVTENGMIENRQSSHWEATGESSDEEQSYDLTPRLRNQRNGSRRDGNRRWERNQNREGRNRDARDQYEKRIEKWNLSFSGDSRSTTLEDFIYKLKILASMNGIPKDNLLSHIHLLLRGEASNWFFTYYEVFWNWEVFENRIRFRFGNPNQEQGNRQKILERKQQKGETFIAFVTEIERLNKLLTKPISNQRKFDTIWENMRQHYRTKLACFTINNLDELIHMNYRIDANDPSLHPMGPKHFVNNVEVESNPTTDSDTEEVNVIARRFQRNPMEKTTQKDQNSNQQEIIRLPLCWNCRQQGHFWRECREVKTTFCYVCGNPGQITSTCDRHPRRNPRQSNDPRQATGN